jgi:hypothetical protein
LWRPNLGIPQVKHGLIYVARTTDRKGRIMTLGNPQVKHGLIYVARTIDRKGRIMKKNGREQGKGHKVSYYVILINNVPIALSRTLYYKKEINKQASEEREPIFLLFKVRENLFTTDDTYNGG